MSLNKNLSSNRLIVKKILVFKNAKAVMLGLGAGLYGFLMSAFFIHLYAINVPIYDEWYNIVFLEKYANGTLSLGDIFTPHNDHQIAAARLAFFGLFSLFGELNFFSEMLFSGIILAFYMSFWVYTLIRLEVSPTISFLSAFILTSNLQWQNTIWGFQITFFLMIFGYVTGILLLSLSEHISWKIVFTLIVLCLISNFSIASGLLSWFVVGILLLLNIALNYSNISLSAKWRANIYKVLVFFTAAIISAIVFFVSTSSADRSGNVFRAQSLSQGLLWFVRAISYPVLIEQSLFGTITAICIWLTIFGALFISFSHRNEHIHKIRLLLLLGLIVFVLINAAIISYSRGGTSDIASRYASVFLWVSAIFLLSLDVVIRSRSRLPIPLKLGYLIISFIALCGVLFFNAVGFYNTISVYQQNRSQLVQQNNVILSFLQDSSPGRSLGENSSTFSPELTQKWLSTQSYLSVLPPSMQSASKLLKADVSGSAWTPNGVPEISSSELLLSWGSWSGTPAITGTITTQPIKVEKPLLVIPVTGYIGMAGQRLIVRVIGSPDAVYIFNDTIPGETWSSWTLDLSQYIGREIQIIGIDDGSSIRAWHGFGTPYSVSRIAWYMNVFLKNTSSILFGYSIILLGFCTVGSLGLFGNKTTIKIPLWVAGITTLVCLGGIILVGNVISPATKDEASTAQKISAQDAPLMLTSSMPSNFIFNAQRRLVANGLFLHPDDAQDFGPFIVSESMCFVSDVIIDPLAKNSSASDGVKFSAEIWHDTTVIGRASVAASLAQPSRIELQVPSGHPFTLRLATYQQKNGEWDWAVWQNPRIDRCSS